MIRNYFISVWRYISRNSVFTGINVLGLVQIVKGPDRRVPNIVLTQGGLRKTYQAEAESNQHDEQGYHCNRAGKHQPRHRTGLCLFQWVEERDDTAYPQQHWQKENHLTKEIRASEGLHLLWRQRVETMWE